MQWLSVCAQVVAKADKPVHWTTPLGLPVVQPYRKKVCPLPFTNAFMLCAQSLLVLILLHGGCVALLSVCVLLPHLFTCSTPAKPIPYFKLCNTSRLHFQCTYKAAFMMANFVFTCLESTNAGHEPSSSAAVACWVLCHQVMVFVLFRSPDVIVCCFAVQDSCTDTPTTGDPGASDRCKPHPACAPKECLPTQLHPLYRLQSHDAHSYSMSESRLVGSGIHHTNTTWSVCIA